MGLTLRPSNPALLAVARAIEANRDKLLNDWMRWISHRLTEAPHVSPPTVQRQLMLIVDLLVHLSGPLRRQAAELWFAACDAYGRTAAARGLAAGEVVEEIQYLRELLIRTLSETIVALPARQSMAAVLRLNRVMDKGIAHAVVGYTDALVESILDRKGIPIVAADPAEDELHNRLSELEEELEHLRIRSA